MTPLRDVPPTRTVSSDYLARIVDDARQRTLDVTRDLRGERLFGPKLSIVNPPLWELGHVGFFNDHFALHLLRGRLAYHYPDAQRLYDSSAIAHDLRWELPLPDIDETLAYLDAVRTAMLACLPDGTASEAESYVYQLAVFHEDMHGEAFAYTRQTLGYPPPVLSGAAAPPPSDGIAFPAATPPGRTPAPSLLNGATALPTAPGGAPTAALTARPAARAFDPWLGDVEVPGGSFVLGSDASVPFRFDNEKTPHTVFVPPFAIARTPVTNAEFAAFVEDGGYQQPAFWSTAGWAWREQAGLEAPVYWRRCSAAGGWEVRWFDRWIPLPSRQPVIHVSWFEAEAWCRWAARRLPSEAEWEVAASCVAAPEGIGFRSGKRRYPWGDAQPGTQHANLDGHRLGCVDVDALSDGDSPLGCRQMIGNVWEWTSSRFAPFPGFRAELYKEYSEPWFAEGRRVLRGGSWATRSRMIHNGYRNFFTPERNDILAGFRTCAP